MSEEYQEYAEVEILMTFLLDGQEIYALLPCAMKKEVVGAGRAERLRLKEFKVVVK